MTQFPRWQRLKRFAFAGVAIGLAVGAAAEARANIVFSDNFNNGVDFGASNPYWLNNNNANGYVVTTTNTSAIFPGSPGYFDQNPPYNSPYYIEGPAPGSTYFLFDATYGTTPSRAFYISDTTFTVTANTNYTVSFYLTNPSLISTAVIQPEIGGQTLGSGVSATGLHQAGWQQFTISWNSGSFSGTSSLTLNDLVVTGAGNDFGIDNIVVSSAVPEPSSLILAILGALGMIGYRRLRRKARN
jgi:PEP-CTERM motif